MHVKFLNHGKGNCRKAADYLLQECDHTGEERADIQVLRGDPHATAAVADSLQFRQKYTSGVIAWSPEDKPTDEQISQVLDDFEKVAFAGLEPDQYTWSAVQHQEADGSKHVHVIVANVDLHSGKSMNIAPPGHSKTYDPLRDFHNAWNGWKSPDDPGLARTHETGTHLKHGSKNREDLIEAVNAYVTSQITNGMVTDRKSMLKSLRDAGVEITRETKSTITVQDPKSGTKARMKGTIYERKFKPDRAIKAESRGQQFRSPENTRRRIKTAKRDLKAAVQRRAEYNRVRHPSSSKQAEINAEMASPGNDSNISSDLDRHLNRQLGADAVDVSQYRGVEVYEAISPKPNFGARSEKAARFEGPRIGRSVYQDQTGFDENLARREHLRDYIEEITNGDDTLRDRITKTIKAAKQRVSELAERTRKWGSGAVERTGKTLKRIDESLQSTDRNYPEGSRAVGQVIAAGQAAEQAKITQQDKGPELGR